MGANTKIEWNKTVASNGYILVRVGKDHHLSDVRGYAYEHRIAAEQKLGRKLRPEEIVHHIDGNKQNNALDNLEVCLSIADHLARHRGADSKLQALDEPNEIVTCACGCGAAFDRFDADGRPRKFISGHNPPDSSKRDAVLAIARDRGEVHAAMIRPILSSKIAAKVMLSRLFKEGFLKRKARGIYGPAH